MKLQAVCFFTALVIPAASSQIASPPTSARVVMDKHCNEVHPGDTVTYSLTVQGLPPAQPVIADLQMRPQHELPLRGKGLPSPDFRNVGGGGTGTPDGTSQNIYNFSFVVPKEIYSGRYRGVEVLVTADTARLNPEARRYVDVSHHTMKRVHEFCLSVVSPFGARAQEPEVTNFQPGAVVLH